MKCLHCGKHFDESFADRSKKEKIFFCSEKCLLDSLKDHEKAEYLERKLAGSTYAPYHTEDGDGEEPMLHGFVIRPMTRDEAMLAIKRRGRESFSYGCAVCILPSARFYAKRDDHLPEGERDEED